MEQLEIAHTEIREVVETIRIKIENVSIVNDFSVDTEGERDLIEQTISDLARVSANQLAGLKTRRNTLVPINRLPVEILTNIILLTNAYMEGSSRLYIKYTWVCHRWRSALIQNSAFWTVVNHQYCLLPEMMVPIYEEILQRSRSAKLELRLSTESVPFISSLKKLFAEESDRICRLQLTDEEDLLQLVLSGKQFPSLQRFALFERTYGHPTGRSFILLAPVLVASDSLETLQCSLGDDISFDQLSPIFRRIRNLSLSTRSLSAVSLVLEMLHDSSKLQTLVLKDNFLSNRSQAESLPKTVLPELQFLSAAGSSTLALFRAPKLLSLNADQYSSHSIAFKDFDLLPIRYLYIRGTRNRRESCDHEARGAVCVLGAKERILCGSLFLNKGNILHEPIHEYPRDCFHFGGCTLAMVLETMAPAILPRLTHLVELYLLIPHFPGEFETLISHLPSIEKLVVQRGNKLLDAIRFLNKTPLPCPRLKYLSFKTHAVPRNIEKYANDVGRSLAKYTQSRRKESADPLEHIILGNCPPLPDTWLEKLQHVGTEVITEKDAENIRVIDKSRKYVFDSTIFSDVEI